MSLKSAIDQLPAFGTAVGQILMPTLSIYGPLLEANRSAITSTTRVEHQYGSLPRQKLDLYSPREEDHHTPVVMFLYGGGFNRGDKRLTAPLSGIDLCYANVGYFFASNGFITAVTDYRRTGEGARFPSGGEDVSAAVSWLKSRLSTGSHDLWVLGNSAGSVHVATWLLEPTLLASRKSVGSGSVVLKGVSLISPPANFNRSDPGRSDVLDQYYGERKWADSACGLLERTNRPNAKVFVVCGSLDPEDEILEPARDFVESWKGRFGEEKLTVSIVEGHNHLSPVLALGTGVEKEETVGAEILQWIKGE